MIKLIGGPAEGSYAVKRAPMFLRAVVAQNGKKDVLDQVVDTPAPSESVHVYQRKGEAGTVHLNMSKVKGFYATGEYYHLPDVNGETVRNNNVWQEWCIVRADEEIGEWP